MKLIKISILWISFCIFFTDISQAEKLKRYPGFFDLAWDQKEGKVLMDIPTDRFEQDFLYLVSLPHGVGSNDIFLDRGQLGNRHVVFFRRSGPKVLMIARNLKFRAYGDNQAEKDAVEEAFAISVLASLSITKESKDKVTLDITPLLLSDTKKISASIKYADQGSFSLAKDFSAVEPSTIKSFPLNTLAEAWLTFKSDNPGSEARSVTPDANSLTVKVRHHFISLPKTPLETRAYHSQSGYIYIAYRDYSAALGQPIEQRLPIRHRLKKKNPKAERSEAVKPIVYYVDSGAPEPIRSALLEGASWWNQAFEEAGFKNAFQVKVLPKTADPMDIRYNIIQWVHRSTRGWSYGDSIVDPRSGEILKGHVSLGSLRVRQDMLIAQGLTSPFGQAGDQGKAAEDMALARLRQLSAHEVGHTLGLAHNFYSSKNNDASVMDYPHPNVKLDENGEITLENAYSKGIGAWDKLAIAYGYREFTSEKKEQEGLAKIISEADSRGLRFISDPDVRGPKTAHAAAHLWDNGEDELIRFDELMAVRKKALENFSSASISSRSPLGSLEATLVPIYLLHRYQAEAVAKQIGGVDYNYALAENSEAGVRTVEAKRQKSALSKLLNSLSTEQLTLPKRLILKLLPPPFAYKRTREYFTHSTANAFDEAAPARAASQLIISMILDPSRAQRLVQQVQTDKNQLGLPYLLRSISKQLIFPINRKDADAISMAVAWTSLRELQRLSVDSKATDVVRAYLKAELKHLAKTLNKGDQATQMSATLQQFLEHPSAEKIPARITVPPGSPI